MRLQESSRIPARNDMEYPGVEFQNMLRAESTALCLELNSYRSTFPLRLRPFCSNCTMYTPDAAENGIS